MSPKSSRRPPRSTPFAVVCALLLWPSAALASPEVYFHRGVLAYQEGRLQDAEQEFLSVLAERPDDVATLHYLALVAKAQDDYADALVLYDRLLGLGAESAEIHTGRGLSLLRLRRFAAARAAFERSIELEPGRARAHLYAGIAAYRAGAFADAEASLERAAELDPQLTDEAAYYQGLVRSLAGDVPRAAGALERAGVDAHSRHGAAARRLREELVPDRAWSARLGAGVELDTNPRAAGDSAGGVPVADSDTDGRAVMRASLSRTLLELDDLSLAAGYDGYLGLHLGGGGTDVGTHAGWLAGGLRKGRARFGLRADYAFTTIDDFDPFRHQVRATPSVTVRVGEATATQLFYQLAWFDYRTGNAGSPQAFDRDGTRHTAGLTQYFFPEGPVRRIRVGVAGEWDRSGGREWAYDGVEGHVGGSVELPFELDAHGLYRLAYRHHDAASVFSPSGRHRDDLRHLLGLELRRPIGEAWEVALAGSFTWNDSDVAYYAYERQIVGVYTRYRF